MTDTLYIPRNATRPANASTGDWYSTPIWGMKTGGKIVCRFVTNLYTTSELLDWHKTRDVWANALVVDDVEYPLGIIPGVFKALDYRIVMNAANEPMEVPAPDNDPLIKYTKPGRFDKGSHATPGRAFYVNVVFESGTFDGKTDSKTPEPGEVIILRLSGAKGDELLQKMDDKQYEEGQGFDPTVGLWELSITGKDKDTTLVARWNRNGGQIDVPEPYNVSSTLDGIRAHVEAVAQSAFATPQMTADGNAAVDAFEETIASAGGSDLDVMSATRLREIADEMKISYPPRANAAQLRDLIKNTTPVDTDEVPF